MAFTAGARPRGDHDRGGEDTDRNVVALDASQGREALAEWIELLARISHDLRTPLNAVIGFSDAMQNELFGPLGHRRYQEYARHIRDSGDRLLSAAEDTLAMTSLLAAPQSVQIGNVRLAEIVDETAVQLAGKLEAAGIDLDIDVEADLQVRADPAALLRAIRHLMGVAIAGTDASDELRISARANHGRVDLVFAVHRQDRGRETLDEPSAHREAPPLSGPTSLGLGRDELPIWLARALLQLQDCSLRIDRMATGSLISIGFEQAAQTDFFGHDPLRSA